MRFFLFLLVKNSILILRDTYFLLKIAVKLGLNGLIWQKMGKKGKNGVENQLKPVNLG